MEPEYEDTDQSNTNAKFMFFDEIKEEEEDVTRCIPKPSANIRVNVRSCKREGKDWVYYMKVQHDDKEIEIRRSYKDIEWLYATLTHRVQLGGYILPPLPSSPSAFQDLPAADLIGIGGEAMFGGLGRRFCLPVEVFLQLLADHRYFAENHIVFNYLTKSEFNQHDGVGLGLSLNQFTKFYSDHQLSSVMDLDSQLGQITQNVSTTIPQLDDCMKGCYSAIIAWQHLACQQDGVRSTLQDLAAHELKTSSTIASVVTSLSEAMMEEALHAGVASLDMTLSLAFTIRHQYGIFVQAKEMLYRRRAKMQTYRQATNQLDRASGKKKEVAQASIAIAEKEYKEITDTCRIEISLFQKQYMVALKSALLGHSEAQIAHSKKTLEQLATLRNSLID